MQGRGWETAGLVTEEQGGRRGWRGDERDAESICVVRNGVAGGGGGGRGWLGSARFCSVRWGWQCKALCNSLPTLPPEEQPAGSILQAGPLLIAAGTQQTLLAGEMLRKRDVVEHANAYCFCCTP